MRRFVAVTILSIADIAMASTPSPSTNTKVLPAVQQVNLDDIHLKAQNDPTHAVEVIIPKTQNTSGIQLDRSFAEAIQGNMDRETMEYRNQEAR
jgi:hypothetical protein